MRYFIQNTYKWVVQLLLKEQSVFFFFFFSFSLAISSLVCSDMPDYILQILKCQIVEKLLSTWRFGCWLLLNKISFTNWMFAFPPSPAELNLNNKISTLIVGNTLLLLWCFLHCNKSLKNIYYTNVWKQKLSPLLDYSRNHIDLSHSCISSDVFYLWQSKMSVSILFEA